MHRTHEHVFDPCTHRFDARKHLLDARSHRFNAGTHRFNARSHRFEARIHRFDALNVLPRHGEPGSILKCGRERGKPHPFCVPFSSLAQYSHDVEADRAYGQNRFALAGSISDAGRPIAQDLIDNPASDFGSIAGAWMKMELPSEAGWRARFEQTHGAKAALAVSPSVTCVSDTGNGTFSAQFGFKNPNNVDVQIPIGVDNRLNPGIDNQGQPVEFPPGAKEAVFVLKGLTAPTRWTLQGQTVKAALGQSPKCSDFQPPEPQQ